MIMSIPLLNARLCLDCDTIFDEPRCPSCDSESYLPVSRWVSPAVAFEKATVRKKAKKASMVLLGTGAAFALWKLLSKTDISRRRPARPVWKVRRKPEPSGRTNRGFASENRAAARR